MSSKAKKAAAPRKKANGYKMPAPIPLGEVILDTVGKKTWRIGPSIGVGGFGEIYSACDHESSPKKGTNAYPFVIKIEPHENGPLFVEKHFYVRNANKDEIAKYMKLKKLPSLGMPTYFGNGSHECGGVKYRYLVLERYGKDIWNIFLECGRRFPVTTVFLLGLQMLEVLEYIHSRGYVHADLKGANILLGLKKGSEHQAYLVDFGLATRVNDKEFKPDPKCAHNGTIEYTSRDAHVGVATMRGDLEILGYNMLQWISGELPWEKSLKQPKLVQDQKEAFMSNVRPQITKNYPDVPEALIKFFEYINTLKPKDVPDYTKCKSLFENYLKSEGKNRNSLLDFTRKKTKSNKRLTNTDSDDEAPKVPKKIKKIKSEDTIGDSPKVKKTKKTKTKEVTDSDNCENEQPNEVEKQKKVVKKRIVKRKSIEPSLVVKIKKTVTPKATPPVKRNHVNMATQTSIERRRKSPRQVSFDSPVCEIIGEKKRIKGTDESANSSGDLFDDSFTIDGKKKRRLIRKDEEITVKTVVKKVTTTKVKSWKNLPSITNGRSPPK